MAGVVGDNAHPIGPRNPGNQEIHLSNQFAPLTELCIQRGCLIKGGVTQRKNVTVLAELLERLQLTVRADGPIASDHFIAGQRSESQTPVPDNIISSTLRDLGMASPEQGERIGIQKHERGHESGSRLAKKRVGSRRAASIAARSSSESPS